MNKNLVRVACGLFLLLAAAGNISQAANPIVPGWYADPEIRIFQGQYWIYPTYSDDYGKPDRSASFTPEQTRMRARSDLIWAPYLKQTFLNAFSSPDLVHWTRHEHVLDVDKVSWAAYAMWAPSAIEHKGKYYLFFGANDIKSNEQLGGIGVAVSDRPGGPFRDALGKPLIGQIHNGAQPIDQMVFEDDDGQIYMYYGGWKHLNVVKLAPDLLGVVPFADGVTYKEITPDPAYVEGSFMAKRKGIYYLMWSEGGWTGPDYHVAYAMSTSPTGPFKRIGTILEQDSKIARGAGHHSVVNIPGTDDWYIVYHRRPLDEKDGNHREMAIDRMYFNEDGTIRPVRMTNEGVAPRPLVLGQNVDELEARMMNDCQALARQLNQSKQLGIREDGMQPLLTWHASCAERPPTGPGDVTALCDGKRVTARGEQGVFFWQKSDRGSLNVGYFDCEDAPPQATHASR